MAEPDYSALVAALLSTGISQQELARRFDVSQPTISRWKTGNIKKMEPEHKTGILDAARLAGVLYDGLTTEPVEIRVVGNIQGGLTVSLFSPADIAEIAPMVDGATNKTVALVVKDGANYPLLRENWLVYYSDSETPPTDAIVGELCVVKLADGRILIRDLLRGSQPGTWTLTALNSPHLVDQDVVWAQTVLDIRPRARNASSH